MKKILRLLGVSGLVATVAVATTPIAYANSSEPGVTGFLSAINSASDQIKSLNAEKSISPNDFHLANVQKFTNPGNAAVLARAVQKNAAGIAALRQALKSNATITAVLASGGVSIDQVVALDVQPGAEITIYYQ